jgi:hypothetical protein
MTTNQKRIKELLAADRKPPRFTFGALVREPYGATGAIDVVFADYQAALDSLAVKPGWYEDQERPPRTPKTNYWYSVILLTGAVLVGEDDLVLVRALS